MRLKRIYLVKRYLRYAFVLTTAVTGCMLAALVFAWALTMTSPPAAKCPAVKVPDRLQGGLPA